MNASALTAPNTPPAAVLVPDHRRMDFLPHLFGMRHLIVAEHTVYRFMERLSPDYGGGFWDFLEYEDRPLYLRPASKGRFRIVCDTNGYAGEVSADAAGIVATLFAFSHLSFADPSDHLADGYARLYAFAADHPEAAAIFAAID